MALGIPYATIQEFKSRYKIDDTEDDVLLTRSLKIASEHIEDNVCKRQFNDADTPTARTFDPTNERTCYVDDFHTMTGFVLKTDEDDDGVFEKTWTTADYELVKSGRVTYKTGRPYFKIKAVKSLDFPNFERQTVEVTARWGWASVPWEVKEATLILAEELWKLKDAPFGIAGMGEFGAVRVRENPKVSALLKEFKREGVLLR